MVGTQAALDVDPAAVQEMFEGHWQRGGPDILASYTDLRTDEAAAEIAGDFVRDKIRSLVHDPETAERLCPRGYPFGSKRLVLEIGYYETFNRDNVTLVDVQADPIEQITPTGVRTRATEYPARRPRAGNWLRRPHRCAVRGGHQGCRRPHAA